MSSKWLKTFLSLTLSVGAVAIVAAPALAQGGTVEVTVADRTNQQVINGARVVIEGTRFTGITDGRGELTIEGVPAGTYEVRVLAIGYRSSTQQITVTTGGTASLAFVLGLSAVSLDEIVVTGTGGAVEKRKLGVTLGTVDVGAIQEVVDVSDFGSVLRARIPGVRSFGTDGGVGSGQELRVRGIASFTLGQRPVVYVDGIRIDTEGNDWGDDGIACCGFQGGSGSDRLNDLNPDDIDRIEVIKGAAAATLYGTEATNGVIQIFTKQGRASSAPRWTLSYGAGFNRLRPNLPKTEAPRFTGPDGTQARDANELIENGLIQRADIGVQGGGENVTYYVSAGYAYEEGSIQPNDQTKANARLNINWTASDRWNFELQSAFARTQGQLLQTGNNWTALLGNALVGNPLTATAERPWGEPWVAIADIREIQSGEFVNRWTGGATVNFNPTETFGHRLTAGLDQVSARRERFHPFGRNYIYVGTDAERSVAYRDFSSYTLDYLGTLGFNLGQSIQSDFSFGAQGFWETDRDNTAIGEGFAGVGVSTVTGAAVRSGRETFEEEINVGLFAQNRFSISDKLFVTGGARLDGNSAFGENFGLQFYPKAELAYVVSEEGFLPGAISTMKVRGAVGMSGKAPGAFTQFRTFSPTIVLEGQNGVRPDNPGNADLEPEKTTEIEGGIDMGLFNDRVSIEATAYYAKTRDALLDVVLPPSLGFPDAQQRNIGALQNKGWELKLDAALIEGNNFRWSSGINMSGNTNKITDLGEFVQNCNEARTECNLGGNRLGRSVGAVFAQAFTGYEYDAANDEHIVSRTDTAVFFGNPLPSWEGNLSQILELGSFRLYGLLSWEKGSWFSNADRPYLVRQFAGDEYTQWLNDDGSATFQSDSVLAHHRALGAMDKRDHIRIQELSLTYSLPNSFSNTFGLGRTTTQISLQNLAWWDDCNCRDPSANYHGGQDVPGFDFLSTPRARTFMFSVRTSF
jgi:TonB-dependent SusC/RagA subfamily outer membrane receptor